MKKHLTPLLLLLAFTSAHAVYNEQGIKTYQKLCKECHGSEFRGAGMLTMDEWDEIYDKGDAEMAALHKDSPKALEMLKEGYYQSRKEDLFDFLTNNAKDAGAVPGCDGNYCGY